MTQVRSWIDDDGVVPPDIAVCARFNTLVDAVIARLRREGIPAVAVKDAVGPAVSGVRVATMHAMKGLEFRCVAAVGVTAGVLPFPPQITPVEVDPLQHRSDMLAEHCLLFVACTRAPATPLPLLGPENGPRCWPPWPTSEADEAPIMFRCGSGRHRQRGLPVPAGPTHVGGRGCPWVGHAPQKQKTPEEQGSQLVGRSRVPLTRHNRGN
ncbi:hypothetical protein [Streptomyces sp. NPDC000229]|uniref:hypothetical protein n=1 Tax=Streptomyces sp. NPDC000229 TaxID=3154247 RepID=UPI003329A217